VLYPYRASAQKNQVRWQFGVLAPRRWSERDGSDPFASQTEVLLEPRGDTVVHVQLRCLQVQARSGGDVPDWDEAVDREVDVEIPLADALDVGRVLPFELPAGQEVADGVHRRRWPVVGLLAVTAERFDGPYGVVKLRVVVENTTDWDQVGATRGDVTRRSLVGTHVLLGVSDGHFVSITDPPEWAGPAAASCENLHTWPVLVGEAADVVLSSPIILSDHPEIAPESPGDLFDATEIDEILSLRTMALTDAEKAEARATDSRAAAIIDRVDEMPGEVLERLHGAIRYLRAVTGEQNEGPEPPPAPPWWDPGADASVDPENDVVMVGGVAVRKGSRVVLRPGARRADAQDLFLVGRPATVQAVLFDVDGGRHFAVTLDDDPGADLQVSHGRFLYFQPDEVEPLP
jgi:hypothetical protein